MKPNFHCSGFQEIRYYVTPFMGNSCTEFHPSRSRNWMVGYNKFMYSLIWRPGQHSLHGYSLQGRRSGDRIPEGARFSAPAQTDLRGPPSLLYNRLRVIPGCKAAGACVDHPSPSSAKVPERVELHLHFPFVFS
jgi:hypothetical protein